MTEILATITLYKKKIENVVNNQELDSSSRMPYITIKKKSEDKIRGVAIDEYTKAMVAEYQSARDLISNLGKLLIIRNEVNDKLSVKINGTVYTVAQAISLENKSVKSYYEYLLNNMRSDFKRNSNAVDRYNGTAFGMDMIQEWIKSCLSFTTDKQLENLKSTDPDKINNLIKQYHEQNDLDLIDPIKLYTEITALNDKLEKFYSEVDFSLSEINARTFIEYDIEPEVPVWKFVDSKEE